MTSLLRLAVVAASSASFVSLAAIVLRARLAGSRPDPSSPRGGAGKGIAYAFTVGMMPWEKESAAKHLPTFVAGTIYHAGIAAFLVYLFAGVLFPGSFSLPLLAVRCLMLSGTAAGFGLLVKRAIKPQLRALSCPDDFASNILIDVCLLLALARSYFPEIESALLFASLVLFLYLPVSKIRHCFFFFYTRILFGVFFGRRGVYP